MSNHADTKRHVFDVTRLDGVREERAPLDPKWELYSQSLVRNMGSLAKAASECLDPLSDPVPYTMDEVPERVKGRVKFLLAKAASETVATRQEVEMFLTRIIRADPAVEARRDCRKIAPMDAVKELCKMKGWYSPVEIRERRELVVPEAILRMSDEELSKMAEEARGEVIDVEGEDVRMLEAKEADDGGDGEDEG